MKDADQILVLDAGRVAERGTHAALLARGGLYASLYREQLARRPRRELAADADRGEAAAAPRTCWARRSTGRCCAGSSPSSGPTGRRLPSPSRCCRRSRCSRSRSPTCSSWPSTSTSPSAGSPASIDWPSLYLLALVGQYGAAFAQLYLTQVLGQLGMNDLRARAHRHILSLSASFFDRTPLGRLMTRLTNDIESLNEMFASGIVSLLGDVVRLTFILIVIFGLDWRLALFSMGSAPVLFAIAAFFRGWVRDAFREIRAKLARMNAFLQEHLSGIKIVQAFAQEKKVGEEFDAINVDYRQANARAISADAALYSIVEAVGSIAVAGLLWHGGGRIAQGR